MYNKQDLIDAKLKNYIKNLNELLLGKTILASKPLSIQILLTNKCNLNCVVCNFKNYHDGTVLDSGLVENILKTNPQLITVEWSGGGEPVLHPDFAYFMDLAQSLQIKQILITNGLLLTEDIIKKIAEYNVNLVLSVDGHSKEIYEKIRVNANYETLMKNINILNKYRKIYHSKSFVRIYYIVIKENYKYLTDMIDLISKNNINEIFFKSDSTHSIFDIVSHGTIEMKQELQNNLKNVLSYAKSKSINCMIDEGMREILLLNADNQYKKTNFKKEGFCLVPWQQIRILPKGDVYPTYFCCTPIGNINSMRLEDLWNSKVMAEYRAGILNHDDNICNECCLEKNGLDRTHSGMDRFLHTLLIK